MRKARAFTVLFLAALLAAMLTWTLAAQDKDNAPVSATGKDDTAARIGSVSIHIVTTPVTVTDRAGNIINGLGPKDFRLTDNGKLQKIDQDVAVYPISMVIAIRSRVRRNDLDAGATSIPTVADEKPKRE